MEGNTSVKLFGRDPALVSAALQALVAVFVAFKLGVSPEQGALISAATAAVVGGYAAYAIKQNILPAVVGIFQALAAVAVAYGLNLSPEQTGVLTAALVGVLGFWLRTQADPKAGSPSEPQQLEVNLTDGHDEDVVGDYEEDAEYEPASDVQFEADDTVFSSTSQVRDDEDLRFR